MEDGGGVCMCVSVGHQTRQDVNRHLYTRELLLRCKQTGGKQGAAGGGDEWEQRRQMSRERTGETSEKEWHMTAEAELDKRGRSKEGGGGCKEKQRQSDGGQEEMMDR